MRTAACVMYIVLLMSGLFTDVAGRALPPFAVLVAALLRNAGIV